MSLDLPRLDGDERTQRGYGVIPLVCHRLSLGQRAQGWRGVRLQSQGTRETINGVVVANSLVVLEPGLMLALGDVRARQGGGWDLEWGCSCTSTLLAGR